MDGTGISFEPLGKLLPPDVKVKVIQYPADKCLSFKETVQCALDQIQTDQEEVIVVAESFSGPVAIELVGSGKLRAKCLILCSTFATTPRPILLKLLEYLPLEWLMELPFPSFILKHVVEGGKEAADLFHSMWKRVRSQVPGEVLVHRLKVINQMDVRKWLPLITIPCLYIQASSDRSVPASSLFDFIEGVPDLRVKRIKGPHFILQAQPQACWDEILNYVDAIQTTRYYYHHHF